MPSFYFFFFKKHQRNRSLLSVNTLLLFQLCHLKFGPCSLLKHFLVMFSSDTACLQTGSYLWCVVSAAMRSFFVQPVDLVFLAMTSRLQQLMLTTPSIFRHKGRAISKPLELSTLAFLSPLQKACKGNEGF